MSEDSLMEKYAGGLLSGVLGTFLGVAFAKDVAGVTVNLLSSGLETLGGKTLELVTKNSHNHDLNRMVVAAVVRAAEEIKANPSFWEDTRRAALDEVVECASSALMSVNTSEAKAVLSALLVGDEATVTHAADALFGPIIKSVGSSADAELLSLAQRLLPAFAYLYKSDKHRLGRLALDRDLAWATTQLLMQQDVVRSMQRANDADQLKQIFSQLARISDGQFQLSDWKPEFEAVGRQLRQIQTGIAEVHKELKKAEPPKIVQWSDDFRPPSGFAAAELLVGERPRPLDLKRGACFRRPNLQRHLLQRASEWLADIDCQETGPAGIPVIWISGPSGAGKSMALLHLLQDLFDAGHKVLWLGESIGQLRVAVEAAQNLQSARRVVIGIDDPFRPDRNSTKHWEDARDEINRLIEAGPPEAIPVIVCCGPTEHFAAFRRAVPFAVPIAFPAWSAGGVVGETENAWREDERAFRSWLADQLGVPGLKNSNVEHALPVLLVWRWKWPEATDLQAFLRSFLAKRLGAGEVASRLRRFLRKVLTLNRLYVGLPKRLYDDSIRPYDDARRQLAQLLKDLHLRWITEDATEGQLHFAHAQIAQELYDALTEDDDVEMQADDVLDALQDCLVLEDQESRLAPLRGLGLAAVQKHGRPRFRREVLLVAIKQCWYRTLEHIDVKPEDASPMLLEWLAIAESQMFDGTAQISPHPAIVLAERMCAAPPESHQEARALSALAGGLDRLPSKVAEPARNALRDRVDQLYDDLEDWQPTDHWIRQWRMVNELEVASGRHGGEDARAGQIGREWLLQFGELALASSAWERTLGIGLLRVSAEELNRVGVKLAEWLDAHSEHERWRSVWAHGTRWRRFLTGLDFDRAFVQQIERSVQAAPSEEALAACFRLTQFALDRDGRWALDPDSATTVRVMVTAAFPIEHLEPSKVLQLATIVVNLARSEFQGNRAMRGDAGSAAEDSIGDWLERLTQRLSAFVGANLKLWRFAWFRLLAIAEHLGPDASRAMYELGWQWLEVHPEDHDWPYVAQRLFGDHDMESRAWATRLIERSLVWLEQHHTHHAWNFLFKRIVEQNSKSVLDGCDASELFRIAIDHLRLDTEPGDWGYVWQHIFSMRDLPGRARLRHEQVRDLVRMAIVWLENTEAVERSEWIFVYESILGLYNDTGPSVRRFGSPRRIRFDLPPWFIAEGVRFARKAGDEQGADGVVAKLLLTGAPAALIEGLGPWLNQHVFGPTPSSHAWIVAQALARRPDGLPGGIQPRDVLTWLERWLTDNFRELPLNWAKTWQVTTRLAAAVDSQRINSLRMLCIHYLEETGLAAPTWLAHQVLQSWEQLQPADREKLDDWLERSLAILGQRIKEPEWIDTWDLLGDRLSYEPEPIGFNTDKLYSVALGWLGVGVSVRFEGIDLVLCRLRRLLGPSHEESLIRRAINSLKALDNHDPISGRFSQLIDALRAEFGVVSGNRLVGTGSAFLASWLETACSSEHYDDKLRRSCLTLWKALWRARSSGWATEPEEWLANAARQLLKFVHRGGPGHWWQTWEGIAIAFRNTPPGTVHVWLTSEALEQIDQDEHKLGRYCKVLEYHNTIMSLEQVTSLLPRIHKALADEPDYRRSADLASQAATLFEQRVACAGPIKPEAENELARVGREVLLKCVFDGRPGESSRWYSALAKAAECSVGDAETLARLASRAEDELTKLRSETGAWVDLWQEVIELPEGQLLSEDRREALLVEGISWLDKHFLHPAWSRTFVSVVENRKHLAAAEDKRLRQHVTYARDALRATRADHRYWTMLWLGLASDGVDEELRRLGTHRALRTPISAPRLGGVLSRLLVDAVTGGIDFHDLLEHCELYLARVDSNRVSYAGVRLAVTRAHQALTASENNNSA